MLTAQKKIKKREIKEDKLVTTYFEARAWLDQNKRLAVYIAAIPIVLLVAVFLYVMGQTEKNQETTTKLAKIIPFYDEGKFDQAINGVPPGIQGLKAIVDEDGSTDAGELATFYLANAYYALGDYDKAAATFDDVDVSDKFIAAAALAGLGGCEEARGKFEEAASWFEKAASKNMSPVQAPDNLSRAAANFAAAGQREKAVELLKTLKKEFPSSQAARDADRFIAQFGS